MVKIHAIQPVHIKRLENPSLVCIRQPSLVQPVVQIHHLVHTRLSAQLPVLQRLAHLHVVVARLLLLLLLYFGYDAGKRVHVLKGLVHALAGHGGDRMRRVAEDDDAALGPGVQLGDEIKGPQVDALERDVDDSIGHDGGEVGASLAQKVDAPGLVAEQLVPAGAVEFLLEAPLLADEDLGAVGALGGNDKGAVLGAHDGHGQGVVGRCLELGTRHGGSDADEVCEFRDEVRVQVLADAGVDAVGADEQLCAGGRAVGKGPGDGGGRLGRDVGELAVVLDGDAGVADHGHEHVDELVAVDAEGLVAVLGGGAKVEVVDGLVVVGVEVELLKVEAQGGDVPVYAQGVEDLEGVGREHDGAANVERCLAGFVEDAGDVLAVEGEGEGEAREAGADDGDVCWGGHYVNERWEQEIMVKSQLL